MLLGTFGQCIIIIDDVPQKATLYLAVVGRG